MKVTPLLGRHSLLWQRRCPSRRVLVVNGNPDSTPERYSAALADAYAAGSVTNGSLVRRLDVGQVDLTEESAGVHATSATSLPDQEIAHVLERFLWADRLFVVYPIWLSAPPPPLQALFDAVAQKCASLRAQFPMLQFSEEKPTRIVATASFPTFFYRPRSLSDERTSGACATTLAGVRLVDSSVIGSVDSMSPEDRFDWLTEIHRLGQTDRDAFSRLVGADRRAS